MDDKMHRLIERCAELEAENALLQGTMNAFIKQAPKDKPSRLNLIGNFKEALAYWRWAETQRMWYQWKSNRG